MAAPLPGLFDSPSCGGSTTMMGNALDGLDVFTNGLGGGGGGSSSYGGTMLPSPGWAQIDDSFALSQLAQFSSSSSSPQQPMEMGMEMPQNNQSVFGNNASRRPSSTSSTRQPNANARNARKAAAAAAAASSSRNTIGPNDAGAIDTKLRSHFPVEVLVQDKDAWRATIAHYAGQMTAGELTRLKQIRRRELQKQYNKGLRDRKRQAANGGGGGHHQHHQQQSATASIFGGLA